MCHPRQHLPLGTRPRYAIRVPRAHEREDRQHTLNAEVEAVADVRNENVEPGPLVARVEPDAAPGVHHTAPDIARKHPGYLRRRLVLWIDPRLEKGGHRGRNFGQGRGAEASAGVCSQRGRAKTIAQRSCR